MGNERTYPRHSDSGRYFLRLWSHSFTLENSGVQTWTCITITGELIKCRILDLNPQCLIHRSETGKCFAFLTSDANDAETILQEPLLHNFRPFPSKKDFQITGSVGKLVLFMKCSLLRTPFVHEPWLFNPHYQHVPLSFFLLGNLVSLTFLESPVSFRKSWQHILGCSVSSLLYFYYKFCLFHNWNFSLFSPLAQEFPAKSMPLFLYIEHKYN